MLTFRLGKRNSLRATVKLTNNSDGKVAFKIKQSKAAKTRYRIKPTNGIIRDSLEVTIQLNKEDANNIALMHSDGQQHEAFRDRFKFEFLQLSDAFFDEIKNQPGEVSEETSAKETSATRAAKIEKSWKDDPNKGNISAHKMKVTFVFTGSNDASGISKDLALKLEGLQEKYNKTCIQYLEAQEQLQSAKRQLRTKDAEIETLNATQQTGLRHRGSKKGGDGQEGPAQTSKPNSATTSLLKMSVIAVVFFFLGRMFAGSI